MIGFPTRKQKTYTVKCDHTKTAVLFDGSHISDWPVNVWMSCVMLCMTSCSDSVSIYSDSCPAIQPHKTWPYLDFSITNGAQTYWVFIHFHTCTVILNPIWRSYYVWTQTPSFFFCASDLLLLALVLTSDESDVWLKQESLHSPVSGHADVWCISIRIQIVMSDIYMVTTSTTNIYEHIWGVNLPDVCCMCEQTAVEKRLILTKSCVHVLKWVVCAWVELLTSQWVWVQWSKQASLSKISAFLGFCPPEHPESRNKTAGLSVITIPYKPVVFFSQHFWGACAWRLTGIL